LSGFEVYEMTGSGAGAVRDTKLERGRDRRRAVNEISPVYSFGSVNVVDPLSITNQEINCSS